jgi:hypothetical protein
MESNSNIPSPKGSKKRKSTKPLISTSELQPKFKLNLTESAQKSRFSYSNGTKFNRKKPEIDITIGDLEDWF